MDYYSIILTAICGGIGGFVGSLLTKIFVNEKNKKTIMHTTLSVLPFITFTYIGSYLSNNQNLRELISPLSKIETFYKNTELQITNDPLFKEKTNNMSSNEIEAYAFNLSHMGLRRLPFEYLESWNLIRIKLAERSDEICSGFWSGKISQSELLKTMETLPDSDIKQWMKISTTALHLELYSTENIPFIQTMIQNAMTILNENINKNDINRFKKVLSDGTAASPKDGCWAVKLIMKLSTTLEKEKREKVIRGLAAI